MTTTSSDALESIDVPRLEALVLSVIRDAGPRGVTADELLARFPTMAYSWVTARPAALKRKGLVADSGGRRPWPLRPVAGRSCRHPVHRPGCDVKHLRRCSCERCAARRVARITRAHTHVVRCGCGAWRWDTNPCPVCVLLLAVSR